VTYSAASTATLDALRGIVAEELKISAAGIARNPKSYPAWHHRQWVVARHPGAVDFERELGLCGKLLDADERNFHCWNYRRWMVGLACEQQTAAAAVAPASTEAAGATSAGPACAGSGSGAAASPPQFSAASELAYTLERIRRNFSNYSAWHYRSVLLLQVGSVAAEEAPAAAVAAPCAAPRDSADTATVAATAAGGSAAASVARGLQPLALSLAREELQLVKRALYTEPDDQSGWFYHRWVVDRVRDTAAASAPSASTPSSICSGAGVACADVGAAPAATAAARCSGGEAADGVAAQQTLEASAAALLLEDAGALLELAEAEPGSKWPRLALAHVFQAFQRTPGLVAAAERARAGGLAAGAVLPSSEEAALISKGVTALFAGAVSPAAATPAPSRAATPVSLPDAAVAVPPLPSIVAMYDAAAAADPIHTACYRSLAQSRGRH
jgi:geranylgeranyl transferase type-2 subunit alpha